MSDFITNLTGTPITGSYSADGTPSGSKNNGGALGIPYVVISETLEGSSFIPGVDDGKGTSPRSGIENTTGVLPEGFGPSGTGRGSFASNSGMINAAARVLGTMAVPQAVNMPKTAQRIGMPWWNHTKGTFGPSGVQSGIYRGQWNPKEGKEFKSGELAGEFPDPPVIRIPSPGGGGGGIGTSPGSGRNPQFPNMPKPTVVDNCECDTLVSSLGCHLTKVCDDADASSYAKHMHVFQGDHDGKSGYWIQSTFGNVTPYVPQELSESYGGEDPFAGGPAVPEDLVDPGTTNTETNRTRYAGDCNTFEAPTNKRKVDVHSEFSYRRKGGGPRLASSGQCGSPSTMVNAIGTGCTFAHHLTFVGTNLSDIGNRVWCDDSIIPPSGASDWFYEGAICNPAKSGKLYSCYEDEFGAIQVSTLLSAGEHILIGSSDDPCDCAFRYNKGAKYKQAWRDATSGNNPFGNQGKFVITGCNSFSAAAIYEQELASGGIPSNLFAIASGDSYEPEWSGDCCGWTVWVKDLTEATGDILDCMRRNLTPPGDVNAMTTIFENIPQEHQANYQGFLGNYVCQDGGATRLCDRNVFDVSYQSSQMTAGDINSSGTYRLWTVFVNVEACCSDPSGGQPTCNDTENCVYIWDGAAWHLDGSGDCACTCYPPSYDGSFPTEGAHGLCSG